MKNSIYHCSIRVDAPDGLHLAGERFGPQDGPLVIFLHGGGQSRTAWRGAAQRLGDIGYTACTMDLRGHGESEWSRSEAYDFKDYVQDLEATIAYLGGQCVGVVGASMGGHIALLAAARSPHLIGLLMLADVTPWIDESLGTAMRVALREARHGFATIEEASLMVSRLRGTPPADNSSGLLRHMRKGEDGRYYFLWDVRLMDDKKLHGGGEGGLFQQAAARLEMPVLVMRGEYSTLTSAQQVEAFRAVHPAVEDVVIAGAGHMVSGDINDAYADAIIAFISAQSPAQRPRHTNIVGNC